MTEKSVDIQKQLNRLKENYLSELPERLGSIERLISHIALKPDVMSLRKLQSQFHQIAGSAFNFGCQELGGLSRELERKVIDVMRNEPTDNETLLFEIQHMSKKLYELIPSTLQSIDIQITPSGEKFKKEVIYILEDDETYAEYLKLALENFGYRSKVFHDVISFERNFDEKNCAMILLDLGMQDEEFGGADSVRKIREKYAFKLPVIVISVRNDFEALLNAVRADAAGYLQKPVEIDRLIKVIENQFKEQNFEQNYRVMIIDDDKMACEFNKVVLESEGMIVQSVYDPVKSCELMSEFSPELLIIDLNMPGCDGIELARVIRFRPEFINVPILFLSAETSVVKQMAALRAGGDEFLEKPIDADILIETVKLKCIRARKLLSQTHTDFLTGLLTHTRVRENLFVEIERAYRLNQELSVALIDIDHFKRINDTYGHLIGDNVISRLAKFIKANIRNIDVVGRFSGEEFILLLPECNAKEAKGKLKDMLDRFVEMDFHTDADKFTVAFSAGVSEFKKGTTVSDMIEQADIALKSSKRSGRSCVSIYET